MPRKADARPLAQFMPDSWVTQAITVDSLSATERAWLHGLQRQALAYFLENQQPHGLVLDRQRNHSSVLVVSGLCSTAATGMGLMAVALASAPEYRLLTLADARSRIAACLETALEHLPHMNGMLPHFVDTRTLAPVGVDRVSTIDSSWLIVGALWAAAFLDDAQIRAQAERLYHRADWQYWARVPDGELGRLRHGSGPGGKLLPNSWERLNGETAFMFLLACGADPEKCLPRASWMGLKTCPGQVAGHCFASADLGLFVFQYSLELLDCKRYALPGPCDLFAEARTATWANHLACRTAAHEFQTYRTFWGLSAGDGPGANGADVYRCYAPNGPVDGTAHLTATLASLSTYPRLVMENISRAERTAGCRSRGRYGYSNVNVDRDWVSRDVVGIDLGAAAMALDNFLHHGRVRRVFHGLECVVAALERLGSYPRPVTEHLPTQRKAS